jgi:hypothetical protein
VDLVEETLRHDVLVAIVTLLNEHEACPCHTYRVHRGRNANGLRRAHGRVGRPDNGWGRRGRDCG